MNQRNILEAVEESGLRQTATMGPQRQAHFQGVLDIMIKTHNAVNSSEEVKMIRQLLYIIKMYHKQALDVVEAIDAECAEDIILETHKDAKGVYSSRSNI